MGNDHSDFIASEQLCLQKAWPLVFLENIEKTVAYAEDFPTLPPLTDVQIVGIQSMW